MTHTSLTTLDTTHTVALHPLTLDGQDIASQTVTVRLTVTGDDDGPGGAWADLTLTNAEQTGEDSFTVDARQARELAGVLGALADRLDALTTR